MAGIYVECLPVGAFQENCYLVVNTETRGCLIVDPGAEGERIIRAAQEYKPAAVLLTHAHWDHIGAVDAVCGSFIAMFSAVEDELTRQRATDVADLPEQFKPYADYLRGRFMLVKKAEMFPVECIVRGYLAGSGLKEYQKQGTVCGIQLPEGLVNSSKLPEPIFTPSTKAEIGDHDENISFERCAEILGEDAATQLRDLAIKVYSVARDHAAENGIIIADTKFEFGVIDGQIILADEVLTPDSSRFWPGDAYEPGRDQASFDKQYVRDWLNANWDRQGNPPHLPQEVIERTSQKYIAAYERISGKKFEF